jgi:hypothetical protein
VIEISIFPVAARTIQSLAYFVANDALTVVAPVKLRWTEREGRFSVLVADGKNRFFQHLEALTAKYNSLQACVERIAATVLEYAKVTTNASNLPTSIPPSWFASLLPNEYCHFSHLFVEFVQLEFLIVTLHNSISIEVNFLISLVL